MNDHFSSCSAGTEQYPTRLTLVENPEAGAMNIFLDTIKPGYTIRSDVFGFYLCSAAEAEQSDTGSNHSAGCDLRLHWETLEEAVSALQNWKPAQSTSAGMHVTAQPASH
jgi:hypothetical protein